MIFDYSYILRSKYFKKNLFNIDDTQIINLQKNEIYWIWAIKI